MKDSKPLAVALFAVGTLLLAMYIITPNGTSNSFQSTVQPTTPTFTEPKPPTLSLNEALDLINAEECKKILYYLASDELEGRMSGKKGNKLAADFIEEEYKKMGIETERDRFSIRRMNPGPHGETGDDFTENIYGYIIGSELPDEVVAVGAHMDHIGYGPSMSRDKRRLAIHPGADDNASGTTALLQIAKAFSRLDRKEIKRTIVFQHYSGEEMGLIGSRHYCNSPTFPRSSPNISKHIAMINMDMVSRLGRGRYFVGFHNGDSSPDLGRIINSLDDKYHFARKITSRGSGGSDHASFYNKRVPVAFLHTGGHPDYHTPRDTADKADYDGLEQVARYATELAWNVVITSSPPRFNHAEFKVMDYVHDHGDGTIHGMTHDHDHPEVPFPN